MKDTTMVLLQSIIIYGSIQSITWASPEEVNDGDENESAHSEPEEESTPIPWATDRGNSTTENSASPEVETESVLDPEVPAEIEEMPSGEPTDVLVDLQTSDDTFPSADTIEQQWIEKWNKMSEKKLVRTQNRRLQFIERTNKTVVDAGPKQQTVLLLILAVNHYQEGVYLHHIESEEPIEPWMERALELFVEIEEKYPEFNPQIIQGWKVAVQSHLDSNH